MAASMGDVVQLTGVAQTRWDGFYNQSIQRLRQDRRCVYKRVAQLLARRVAAFVARFVVCTLFGVPGIVAVLVTAGGSLAPERTVQVLTTPSELQYAALATGAVGLAAGLITALIMAPVAQPSIRRVIRQERARTAEAMAMREWQGWVEQQLARAQRRPATPSQAKPKDAG